MLTMLRAARPSFQSPVLVICIHAAVLCLSVFFFHILFPFIAIVLIAINVYLSLSVIFTRNKRPTLNRNLRPPKFKYFTRYVIINTEMAKPDFDQQGIVLQNFCQ